MWKVEKVNNDNRSVLARLSAAVGVVVVAIAVAFAFITWDNALMTGGSMSGNDRSTAAAPSGSSGVYHRDEAPNPHGEDDDGVTVLFPSAQSPWEGGDPAPVFAETLARESVDGRYDCTNLDSSVMIGVTAMLCRGELDPQRGIPTSVVTVFDAEHVPEPQAYADTKIAVLERSNAEAGIDVRHDELARGFYLLVGDGVTAVCEGNETECRDIADDLGMAAREHPDAVTTPQGSLDAPITEYEVVEVPSDEPSISDGRDATVTLGDGVLARHQEESLIRHNEVVDLLGETGVSCTTATYGNGVVISLCDGNSSLVTGVPGDVDGHVTYEQDNGDVVIKAPYWIFNLGDLEAERIAGIQEIAGGSPTAPTNEAAISAEPGLDEVAEEPSLSYTETFDENGVGTVTLRNPDASEDEGPATDEVERETIVVSVPPKYEIVFDEPKGDNDNDEDRAGTEADGDSNQPVSPAEAKADAGSDEAVETTPTAPASEDADADAK